MLDWASSIPEFFMKHNDFFWVLANIIVAYNALVIIVFVIMYYIFFDPRATTAGRFVFRFMVSLVGVIGLAVIGIYLDPAPGQNWMQSPSDSLWWRPISRVFVYGYVAYSVTALAVLVVLRKWWPDKIRTSRTRELLETRR